MARGDQLARQWKIIQTLLAARKGKSAADLAAVVGCGWRTVYRDLEALQAAGFPFYTEKEGGKSTWSLLDTTGDNIPLPLSPTELMALYFSRSMMEVLRGTVFYDSLESLFEKIKATLPPEYLAYLSRIEQSLAVISKPYKRVGKLREMIERISQAVAQKNYIKIVYYTMSRKKQTRRKVAPYKIWFFDGTFYLIGNCGLREDIRIFALDRIKQLEQTDESFEVPADFDIDDFMKASFGVFHGEPVTVRIRFAPEVAEYIKEKTWHASQRIEPRSDGSILFEVQVAGIKEIKFWLLRWGAKAVVLSPPSLRREMRQEAEAMLKNMRTAPD